MGVELEKGQSVKYLTAEEKRAKVGAIRGLHDRRLLDKNISLENRPKAVGSGRLLTENELNEFCKH